MILVGCTTVIPPTVVSEGASFDNGLRNSGLIGFTTNSVGYVQVIVTPHARDRYNGLAEKYGNRIIPPVVANYGVTDNQTNCYMTLESFANFIDMNKMYKRDKR